MSNEVSGIDFETFVKNNPTVEAPAATATAPVEEEKKQPVIKSRGTVVVPDKVMIQASPLHNQGVFAKVDILEEETVEVCPLLQLGWRMQYQNDPVAKKYIWSNTACNCNDCKMNSPIAYMPLGYGSLYNHSNEPNVKVDINWVEQTATFKAIRTILVGEELLIQYGK
jgi:hypothetical protein